MVRYIAGIVSVFKDYAKQKDIDLVFVSDRNTLQTNYDFDKLNKIEGILEEMQSKQKEQANSGTPIVASLEAMSKYYIDYLAKQKSEGENKEKS